MDWNKESKQAGANINHLTEVELEIARLLLEAVLPLFDLKDKSAPGLGAIRVTHAQVKTVANSP